MRGCEEDPPRNHKGHNPRRKRRMRRATEEASTHQLHGKRKPLAFTFLAAITLLGLYPFLFVSKQVPSQPFSPGPHFSTSTSLSASTSKQALPEERKNRNPSAEPPELRERNLQNRPLRHLGHPKDGYVLLNDHYRERRKHDFEQLQKIRGPEGPCGIKQTQSDEELASGRREKHEEVRLCASTLDYIDEYTRDKTCVKYRNPKKTICTEPHPELENVFVTTTRWGPHLMPGGFDWLSHANLWENVGGLKGKAAGVVGTMIAPVAANGSYIRCVLLYNKRVRRNV